ncbi:MAG: methylmalonyl-CoA mutase, partial [Gammaproteobacteria bacterium]|nr:methylmalonyl-CoA mutase [Gammaproteobacteria bacterium]
TGHHQSPVAIVEAALQEEAVVVEVSILSGAHMTLLPRVKALLDEAGLGDVLVTGGGIIPKEDAEALHSAGIGRLFGPGTRTGEAVAYIRTWFASSERAAT